MGLYKLDWEEVKKRYERFWSPERFGPIVQIYATRIGAGIPAARPAWTVNDDAGWWFMQWLMAGGKDGKLEPAAFFADYETYFLQRHRYIGDAYPHFWLNMGSGILAAFLTGYLKFDGNTTWFEHDTPLTWDQILSMKWRDDNPWWQALTRNSSALAKLCVGKCVVGMADIGGATDVLASLRTPAQLLEDCLNEPKLVLEATALINRYWFRCFDGLHAILTSAGAEGSSAWMGLWSSQRWYPLQCDFSAMIGPKHFEQLVLPGLVEQAKHLDNAIYHWDGPGEIPHLDLILSVPEIHGVQWVPGASQPGCEDPRWYPYYERVQKAEKRLVVGVSYLAVEPFVKRFGPKGLVVSTWANEEEGLKLAERLGMIKG